MKKVMKPVTLCELIRRSRGATPVDVANLAGVSRRTVERIESAKSVSEYSEQCVAIAVGYTGRPSDLSKALMWGGGSKIRMERGAAT